MNNVRRFKRLKDRIGRLEIGQIGVRRADELEFAVRIAGLLIGHPGDCTANQAGTAGD